MSDDPRGSASSSDATQVAFDGGARRSEHPRGSVLPDADLLVPADLGPRGAGVWRATVAGMDFRSDEIAVLHELCRTLDEIDGLREAIALGGLTVAGSKGQPRPNPLLASLHASRALLIRLAQQLALPDPEEEVAQSAASKRAQHAAQARWAGHAKVTRESRHASP